MFSSFITINGAAVATSLPASLLERDGQLLAAVDHYGPPGPMRLLICGVGDKSSHFPVNPHIYHPMTTMMLSDGAGMAQPVHVMCTDPTVGFRSFLELGSAPDGPPTTPKSIPTDSVRPNTPPPSIPQFAEQNDDCASMPSLATDSTPMPDDDVSAKSTTSSRGRPKLRDSREQDALASVVRTTTLRTMCDMAGITLECHRDGKVTVTCRDDAYPGVLTLYMSLLSVKRKKMVALVTKSTPKALRAYVQEALASDVNVGIDWSPKLSGTVEKLVKTMFYQGEDGVAAGKKLKVLQDIVNIFTGELMRLNSGFQVV
jgi:hypothetical protein